MAEPSTLALPGPGSDPHNAVTDGKTKHLLQGHFSPMNSWVRVLSSSIIQPGKVGHTK